MVSKGIRELLTEAGAVVETVSVADARSLVGNEDVVFVDVRESQERAQGYVAGSIHAPRGFLEFIADPQTPIHDPAFSSGKRLILYCGSGTRSALAGRSLAEMGLTKLANLEGGFQAWVQAGGPCER
jgi:rhodanese-related sulfurtransferase